MIESINIHHPTVVIPGAPLEERFQYAEYGTLSINGQTLIPVPTETLMLIQEHIRIAMEND